MKRFRAAQIQRRRDTRSAVALDGDQNPIRKGDKVKVMDGPFINREGEVKHLYRGTAFIYNRKVCLVWFLYVPEFEFRSWKMVASM